MCKDWWELGEPQPISPPSAHVVFESCFAPALRANAIIGDVPVISMFYGLIVRMYAFDTQKHQAPHIHVQYAD